MFLFLVLLRPAGAAPQASRHGLSPLPHTRLRMFRGSRDEPGGGLRGPVGLARVRIRMAAPDVGKGRRGVTKDPQIRTKRLLFVWSAKRLFSIPATRLCNGRTAPRGGY